MRKQLSQQKLLEILCHEIEMLQETSKNINEIAPASACSFAIISTEELVKAFIVFWDGQGFNFRKIKGMSTIFRNHRIRYFILFLLYVMGLLNDELRKLMSTVIQKPPSVLARYYESKIAYLFICQ